MTQVLLLVGSVHVQFPTCGVGIGFGFTVVVGARVVEAVVVVVGLVLVGLVVVVDVVVVDSVVTGSVVFLETSLGTVESRMEYK